MFIDVANNLVVEEKDCIGGVQWYAIRRFLETHYWSNPPADVQNPKSIVVPKFTHFYGIPVYDDGKELGGVAMNMSGK